MTRIIDLTYAGIEFEVKGNWEKGYAETRLDPGESTGFDDYSIFHGGDDITDLLDSHVAEDILERATAIGIDEDDNHYTEPEDLL